MARPRRRRGCCGCLTTILVLVLVVVGWMALVHSGWLEKLGLRESVAKKVFAAPPDRQASAAVMQMLQQGGMNTQGVSVYVLPMVGHEGSAALVTLDASQGFDIQRFLDTLGGGSGAGELFDENALRELNVTRVAFEYVNDQGKPIVTLTASVDDLQRAGESEDEQALLKALMGHIDLPGLIQEMTP